MSDTNKEQITIIITDETNIVIIPKTYCQPIKFINVDLIGNIKTIKNDSNYFEISFDFNY